MKKQILTFVCKYLYPLTIVLITIILALVNYKSGTFLSGWDTLHPEFDFQLNFKRIIDGVWREEQGLGAVAGHSHMSELPRYIILYVLSFLLPLSSLRYLYVFLCLGIGSLGMYYLLWYLLKNKQASFLGSMFYIFNQAVLQQFYVPFEMFTTHYAALPWLFLFAIKFVNKEKKKDLWYFALTTFLALPMAYAAQLWYAYFLCFVLFIFTFIRVTFGRLFGKLPIAAYLIGITLAINSLWLLPNLYFLKNNAFMVPQAHINELFSERMFAFNKAFGRLSDVMVLRGPLYDWTQFDGEKFIYLFGSFRNYLEKPVISLIGYLGFVVVFLGVILAIVKKEKKVLGFLPLLIVSFIFLINMNPPFDWFFALVRDSFPIVKEALRSPYTKFCFLALFAYSVYFAYANKLILKKLNPILKNCYILIFSLSLMLYMLPSFGGQLIDPYLKINIPNEYFYLFSWLKTQPSDGRIAVVPDHSVWGWDYYQFGYQGAGFIWFGIKQPVLIREFDRWNSKNENYYWEISYATYSQNLPLLEKVLEKYQVSWLLVDGNVISPDSPKSLYLDKLDDLLSQSQKITLAQTFGNIKVYRVQLPYQTQNFTFTVQNPVQVALLSAWNNDDRAYADNGTYFSYTDNRAPKTENQVYYPFRSLFTGRKQGELEFVIQDTKDTLVIRPKNNVEVSGQLTLETGTPDELSEIDRTDLSKMTIVKPKLFINGALVEGPAQVSIANLSSLWVEFPKVAGLLSYDSIKDDNLVGKTPVRCDTFRNGPIKRQPISGDGKELLRFSSIDSSNCMDIDLPNLPQDKSYIIAIDSRNIKGKSLLFSVINKNSRKSDTETYLPENNKSQNVSTSYFVLPPMEQFGAGYTLHFDNISIGDDEVVNDLGAIAVYQFPYSMLKGIVFTSTQSPANQQTLVLSQSYDEGWKAYQIQCQVSSVKCQVKNTFPFLFGEELKEHVLVNNWANGWLLNNETMKQFNNETIQIKIVYLPQYLEYVGFGLLIVGLIVVLQYKHGSVPGRH